MMAGSVTYSRRFYEEVLRDPATASPLIFPETVFNAPASHLAAYLNSPTINYTLVGDDGDLFTRAGTGGGLAADDQVDACLVVGARKRTGLSPTPCDFSGAPPFTLRGGCGLFEKEPVRRHVKLATITDSFTFTKKQSCLAAVKMMEAQFRPMQK